jgi:uncharacterized repeat protein (TIGR01451 family)
MKKTLLYSTIALALVLGLFLPMAVMASEITVTKNRDPDDSPYEVGETIHYVMSVTNPGNNTATNTLTRIWDTLPNGTVIEFLYPGSPYGNAAGGSELVQSPGDSANFTVDYMVRARDIVWIDALGDYGVRNRFEAEGSDSGADAVYGLTTSSARVNQPPVGGEAFPVGKLSLLAPWIALGAAVIAGAGIFIRRRQVQS